MLELPQFMTNTFWALACLTMIVKKFILFLDLEIWFARESPTPILLQVVALQFVTDQAITGKDVS